VLLLPSPASADSQKSARTEVTLQGQIAQVRSRIEAPASIDVCYGVLADFDRLAEFIPDMQSSTIVSLPGDPLLLRQVGQTSTAFLTFAFDVTLAVTVDPPHEIAFSRVAGNLEQMQGQWQISGDASHCAIDYRADIKPAFWVPPFIGPVMMRRQVEGQIRGLRAEIKRRSGQAPETP
jgi:ribosome-associated toxin RatA of RatAB toxin-antitoxin module